MTKFRFKPFVKFESKVSAQVVGERLGEIEQRYGVLTAKMVLKDAESESSPLHPLIDWNDKTAAKKWRLQQAGYIIRAVVQIEDEQGEKLAGPPRAFARVYDEQHGSHYVSTLRAMSDKEQRHQILTQALAEMESFQQKYSNLVELADLFQQMERTKARLKKKQAEAKPAKKGMVKLPPLRRPA